MRRPRKVLLPTLETSRRFINSSMPGRRSEAMMYLFVYCCDRSGARLRARPRDTGTLTTLPSLGGRCQDRQHGAVSSELHHITFTMSIDHFIAN